MNSVYQATQTMVTNDRLTSVRLTVLIPVTFKQCVGTAGNCGWRQYTVGTITKHRAI